MGINTTPVEFTVTQVGGDVDLIEVLVRQPVIEVEVQVPGSQGIPGPQGPVGSDLAYYEVFAAADTWTVNHNLGKRPVVQVFSVGGVAMMTEVIQTSVNQALVYFDQATAGYVICS